MKMETVVTVTMNAIWLKSWNDQKLGLLTLFIINLLGGANLKFIA
jgi:hypothetical protein